MSTTTICLPDPLKSRVANAAKRAGTTTHNFIREAIAEKTEQVERKSEFVSVADERYANLVASGKTIPWDQMRRFLEGTIAGKAVRRPRARKLAR